MEKKQMQFLFFSFSNFHFIYIFVLFEFLRRSRSGTTSRVIHYKTRTPLHFHARSASAQKYLISIKYL